jgi:hypothetical protein
MKILNAKYHSWSIFCGFHFSFWTRPSGSLSYISPRFREFQTWGHLSDNRNSLFFVTSHRRCQLEAYIHAMCKYLLHRIPRKHGMASPACPDKSGFKINVCMVYLWHDTDRLNLWHDTDRLNSINWEQNRYHFHLLRHTSNTDWPRIEPESPRSAANLLARIQRERE